MGCCAADASVFRHSLRSSWRSDAAVGGKDDHCAAASVAFLIEEDDGICRQSSAPYALNYVLGVLHVDDCLTYARLKIQIRRTCNRKNEDC